MSEQNVNRASQCSLRIGAGYDIHRLVPGRKLILGGIFIPYERGLEGHSDGDALCHAIMDALLGGANLGDIGLFFPTDDAKFSGANSGDLLAKVREMLAEKNYGIVNIDNVIICQRPKLAHFYSEMQANISRLLQVEVARVSLKAKTAEELGVIGRGEAIAVQSTALIEKLRA